MINGGFVSSGPMNRRGHPRWRWLTIIRSIAMVPTANHPGEHLAEELAALDMSAAELGESSTCRPIASRKS